MDVQTLYADNDMVIEVAGLRDEVTGAYINDATVTVALADEDAVAVVGESWPLAMGYVTSSDGTYRATLRDTLTLAVNARYVATVIADAGQGRRGQWELDFVCRKRRD